MKWKGKEEQYEPGLLAIFRAFLIIQLGLTVGNVLLHSHVGDLAACPWYTVAVALGCTLLLLGYLSWPGLSRYLGRLYLPSAVALAVFVSLLVQGELLAAYSDPRDYVADGSTWQVFLYLFFPLVLVAWQYDFSAAILYSAFSGALELVMLHFSNSYELYGDAAYQRQIVARTLVFLVAALVISGVMKRQRRQRQELIEANLLLSNHAATLEQLTTTRERNRMACELHDTLAHTLSGLAVQLEAVRSAWPSAPDKAGRMLDDALASTRNGLTETRRAIGSLRASLLEDLGLGLAVRDLAEDAASRMEAHLDLEIPATIEVLPPAVEQGVYRVAQEALENAVRHSEARRLGVRLATAGGCLTLTVTDDGRGFDVSKADLTGHFGLMGIRERAEMVGGSLEVRSRPGEGTVVELSMRTRP
jgi:signal transduction histidine kinase